MCNSYTLVYKLLDKSYSMVYDLHMKNIYNRILTQKLIRILNTKKSVLILGPRQVGKSTLIRDSLSKHFDFDSILLQNPEIRIKYEQNPSRLIHEYELDTSKSIIFIDEIQKVPQLFDAIQYLIDEHKKQFILTGSSARKLRKIGSNLLPGRVILYSLDPMTWNELNLSKDDLIKEIAVPKIKPNKMKFSFEEAMNYGTLPEVVQLDNSTRKELLRSYSTIYLEEEIRIEALSRNIGSFSSFLELVASESGSSPNFSKLSNEVHISILTIREYFQILSDTLIIHKLPAYTKSLRRRLSKTFKYYFFDIGVKNALAKTDTGHDFEHFVILEMFRRQKLIDKMKIYYWRTQTGQEVDLIIDVAGKTFPIEIKAQKNINLRDVSGLTAFLEEYKIEKGYVISLDDKPYKISKNITVIPWNYI